jgi:methylase of polypeptide subunit release factors
LEKSNKESEFDGLTQKWMSDQDWLFSRRVPEEWAKSVDHMAKTLVYVWSNRLLFYKALRARFAELPVLKLRTSIKTASEAVNEFGRFFERAVERSGDYEPLLMPEVRDRPQELVFLAPEALDSWRGLLKGIEPIDFSQISSDVIGRIFQKLIDPEERHRYGQHFTGDDIVDVINGFCIRAADDTVLDPACGSGSFLVRAYYRKKHLSPKRPHLDLIGELFGCDISMYPAHLATLNLAAREINEEANYPRISRRDFFDFDPKKAFCRVPDLPGTSKDVMLPPLSSIVGNPPYVRQEKIDKDKKSHYANLAVSSWPGLKLSGRSDLHCYFWPVAARLLKKDGYFGFLTSSSWLDVEYGFALQEWTLRHFRILAIMESGSEPWFEDARVKTCVTILQRCDEEKARSENLVRFVRFDRPLNEFLDVQKSNDGKKRFQAVEHLRAKILTTDSDLHVSDMRIIVKHQQDLWDDGVRASVILTKTESPELEEGEEEESSEEKRPIPSREIGTYAAGKWGRYLRAPEVYFEIISRFKNKFIPLGEICQIRFGVKSGCDAFFMPKDVTAEYLERFPNEKEFMRYAAGASRRDVSSGKLMIIESGDRSVHPIESKYLAPEVHSLMSVNRPNVKAEDLNRVVRLISEPLNVLKGKAPWAYRYVQFGGQANFESNKSKPVPIPKRSTCASRKRWYDLTGLVRPGFAFWPMAQQYRHIIAANPQGLICNHNLFDLFSPALSKCEQKSLIAILNSSLIALFKTFYGRFAGTEGNLKTEVVDVNLIEVPDPRGLASSIAGKLAKAFGQMSKREIGRLVEEKLMDCHDLKEARRIAEGPLVFAAELEKEDRNALDDAVFEALGVSSPKERLNLKKKLYEAIALHFRKIRVVEIEKMEQRSKTDDKRINLHDLIQDIWDAADIPDSLSIRDWLSRQPEADAEVQIPEERPVVFPDNPLFDLKTIKFGLGRGIQREYASKEQARLVSMVAETGISGKIRIPAKSEPCIQTLDRLLERIKSANVRFLRFVESRTSDEKIQKQLLEALMRRFVQGQ